jgi:hypothetical protein
MVSDWKVFEELGKVIFYFRFPIGGKNSLHNSSLDQVEGCRFSKYDRIIEYKCANVNLEKISNIQHSITMYMEQVEGLSDIYVVMNQGTCSSCVDLKVKIIWLESLRKPLRMAAGSSSRWCRYWCVSGQYDQRHIQVRRSFCTGPKWASV